MPWTCPTYQTAHGMAHPGPATCPACGRRTTADMLLDQRRLPEHLRAAMGRIGAADFACDSCRERVFRRRLVSRLEYFAGLGAPPEFLERRAEKDRRSSTAGS